MKSTSIIAAFVLGASLASAGIVPSKANLMRHDANKDGSLSSEEVNKMDDAQRAAALDAYDGNDDSAISAKELKVGPIKKAEPAAKKGGAKKNKKKNRKRAKKKVPKKKAPQKKGGKKLVPGGKR